jgi:serine/threonine protein kinase
VRVARFFEANKTAYMVLEYERGQSLKAWRKKRGDNIPEQMLVTLLAPLLDGLAVVHKSGYLHRDIKPDNIYVRDEDGSLVLLDFGAARQTASEKAEIGTVVTPGYGPIEQYAGGGRQGPWTDIYALGATLFWLVSGRKPIDAPARLSHPRSPAQCRIPRPGPLHSRIPEGDRLGAQDAPQRASPGRGAVPLRALRRACGGPGPGRGAAPQRRRRQRCGRNLGHGPFVRRGC